MNEELHKNANFKLFIHAKENRKKLTHAENILWGAIRNKKLNGLKFRRQHPISDFIADFYCHSLHLVIELDGQYHEDHTQKEYDIGRTYELNELNVLVLRISNEDVINRLDSVLKTIINFANKNQKY